MLELARRAALERALRECGMSLDQLCAQAQALALFGSRALGCERRASDWDLLCVGGGRSQRLGRVDLVCVDPRALEGGGWLGGDLAGHVAAYGVWLHGACPWQRGDVRFDAAASRKEERIARKIQSLGRVWEHLGPSYREKHATLVRREVQRLALLGRGAAVPPTAHLDLAWLDDGVAPERLREALALLEVAPWLAEALVEHAAGSDRRPGGSEPASVAPAARAAAR